MTYTEFLSTIKKNNLSIREVSSDLGYSYKSILNNWKENDRIPEKAAIMFKMLITIKQQREKINKLVHQPTKNSISLSPKAYLIAIETSNKYGITIEEYLNSLIIAKI